MKAQNEKSTTTTVTRKRRKECQITLFFSSQRPPFSERRVIDPNGILLAPPILLLLHHMRHLGNFRSPPIWRLCVGHQDNQRHPLTTDRPCRCFFFCTRDTVYCPGYVKLLLLLLLRRLRTWWPHWPAAEEAIGPKPTRTRRGWRYCLFRPNTADIDGQRGGGGVLPVPFFLTGFITNPHLPQFRHTPISASDIVGFRKECGLTALLNLPEESQE